MQTKSVFQKYESKKGYPYKFSGQLLVGTIAGGTPSEPKVAEAWLRSKIDDKDNIIRGLVAETMLERGVGPEEALQIVDIAKHLNGFKRDPEHDGMLYIEGRQLKAAIKEAASVAVNAGKLPARGWGSPDDAAYKKGLKGWLPEHVFVVEEKLHLGVQEPTGIVQRFISTFRGTGIQYEEYVDQAVIDFTVITDHKFTDEQWAAIWLTLEKQGIGASRSQGFGTCTVTKWEAIK